MHRIKPAFSKFIAVVCFLACVLAARGDTVFPAGTLIIPMDTDSQNSGMLRAYGLVYELLRNEIPVHWVINSSKAANGIDFTVATGAGLQRVRNGSALSTPRSFRGGPFVIETNDVAAALPFIQSWQATGGDVTEVYRLTNGAFTGTVARTLRVAPRLGVLLDGNESIAFNNYNAAGIRDSTGSTWTAASSAMLTEGQVIGSSTNDLDGSLFLLPGVARRYAHLVSLHYDTTSLTTGVVKEVRSWLGSGQTFLHAQCQSISTFENDDSGLFLTTGGVQDDGVAPTSVTNRSPAATLSQVDGTFATDSGAVDSIGLSVFSSFRTGVQTLFNDASSPLTQRIVLLAGRMDGNILRGQVAYLAGHDFTLSLPVTSNPQVNGIRLFLNGVLTSDAATQSPGDDVILNMTAPASASGGTIFYTLSYSNASALPAEAVQVWDILPSGTTYNTSSIAPASISGGIVKWHLATLASGATGTISLTVNVASHGTHTNNARVYFARNTLESFNATPRETVHAPAFESIALTTNALALSIAGLTGRVYEIQTSSNLTDWLVWFAETNITGILNLLDPSPTNPPAQFYRALPTP